MFSKYMLKNIYDGVTYTLSALALIMSIHSVVKLLIFLGSFIFYGKNILDLELYARYDEKINAFIVFIIGFLVFFNRRVRVTNLFIFVGFIIAERLYSNKDILTFTDGIIPQNPNFHWGDFEYLFN